MNSHKKIERFEMEGKENFAKAIQSINESMSLDMRKPLLDAEQKLYKELMSFPGDSSKGSLSNALKPVTNELVALNRKKANDLDIQNREIIKRDKEAKRTRRISIIAIIIAFASLVASIITGIVK